MLLLLCIVAALLRHKIDELVLKQYFGHACLLQFHVLLFCFSRHLRLVLALDYNQSHVAINSCLRKELPCINEQEKDAKEEIELLSDEYCVKQSQNGSQVEDEVSVEARGVHLDHALSRAH